MGKIAMNSEQLAEILNDAGCHDQTVRKIVMLDEAGNDTEVLQLLKTLRCELMEDLHRTGRKVDCLDYLIRQKTEMKEKQTKEEI